MCVSVCVREINRERERERVRDVLPEAQMLFLFVLSMHADTHGKSLDTVFPLFTHTC